MTYKTDLSGKVFGLLTVIERAPDYVSPKGSRKARWLCKCECGGQKIVTQNDLVTNRTTSCGCYNRRKNTEKSLIDLTGLVFGQLKVMKRVGSCGKSPIWLCSCECGNTIVTKGVDLRRGHTISCGPHCPIKKEKMSKRFLHDITGETFGRLTVIQRANNSNNGNTQWLCQCTCGRTTTVEMSKLVSGHTTSCGCIYSRGENEIINRLIALGVEFQTAYRFPDLFGPNGGQLMFDVAIFSDNRLLGLIEYQGQQHYLDIDFGRYQREVTDKIKKDYCLSRDIHLYEIRFDENIESKLNDILHALHVNPVPKLSNE